MVVRRWRSSGEPAGMGCRRSCGWAEMGGEGCLLGVAIRVATRRHDSKTTRISRVWVRKNRGRVVFVSRFRVVFVSR
ncbi:hypothetical protein TIFTF001_027047, partial [Ficus carica]